MLQQYTCLRSNLLLKNVKTLKKTDTKKIVSFTKDDGLIGYAIS